MKKICNLAKDFVNDSLEGILAAYPNQLKSVGGNLRVICRRDTPVKGKVAIVTGGGYGHLPTFLGYVGQGFADGVAVGNSFTSPSSESIASATRQCDSGKGVLYLYGNYFGDTMNFDMAAEIVSKEGIQTKSVRVCDDIASAARDKWQQRRAVAGLFFAYKTAGAKSDMFADISEVVRIAEKTVERLATLGFAMTSCSLPGENRNIFQIEEDEMELGMGIHGEAGVVRTKMMTSLEISNIITEKISEDLSIQPNTKIAVLINGLASTSLEELYVLFRDVKLKFESKKVIIERVFIGKYATSFEMAGASLSVLKLDSELLQLLDAPAKTPFICI